MVHIFFAQCSIRRQPACAPRRARGRAWRHCTRSAAPSHTHRCPPLAGVTNAGLRARPVKRVAVLGGGLMGSGIATACVLSGIDVLLKEVNQKFLDVSLVVATCCFPCRCFVFRLFSAQKSHNHERPCESSVLSCSGSSLSACWFIGTPRTAGMQRRTLCVTRGIFLPLQLAGRHGPHPGQPGQPGQEGTHASRRAPGGVPCVPRVPRPGCRGSRPWPAPALPAYCRAS